MADKDGRVTVRLIATGETTEMHVSDGRRAIGSGLYDKLDPTDPDWPSDNEPLPDLPYPGADYEVLTSLNGDWQSLSLTEVTDAGGLGLGETLAISNDAGEQTITNSGQAVDENDLVPLGQAMALPPNLAIDQDGLPVATGAKRFNIHSPAFAEVDGDQVSFRVPGKWHPDVLYRPGAIALHNGGIWEANDIIESNLNQEPVAGSEFWTQLNSDTLVVEKNGLAIDFNPIGYNPDQTRHLLIDIRAKPWKANTEYSAYNPISSTQAAVTPVVNANSTKFFAYIAGFTTGLVEPDLTGTSDPVTESTDRQDNIWTPLYTWFGEWAAITNVPTYNAIIRNGCLFINLDIGGTTALVEPVWPTDGSTVVDGMVTWRDSGTSVPGGTQTWAGNSNYELATEVIPTTPNGHFYTVEVVARLTGLTEPDWSTVLNYADTIQDGDVQWTNFGPAQVWSPSTLFQTRVTTDHTNYGGFYALSSVAVAGTSMVFAGEPQGWKGVTGETQPDWEAVMPGDGTYYVDGELIWQEYTSGSEELFITGIVAPTGRKILTIYNAAPWSASTGSITLVDDADVDVVIGEFAHSAEANRFNNFEEDIALNNNFYAPCEYLDERWTTFIPFTF